MLHNHNVRAATIITHQTSANPQLATGVHYFLTQKFRPQMEP